jgi:hypothetical protein
MCDLLHAFGGKAANGLGPWSGALSDRVRHRVRRCAPPMNPYNAASLNRLEASSLSGSRWHPPSAEIVLQNPFQSPTGAATRWRPKLYHEHGHIFASALAPSPSRRVAYRPGLGRGDAR